MNDDEKVEQAEDGKGVEQTGTPASDEGKSYTQDDLNRLFGERAKQANNALLNKLGFKSLEEAEALTKKAREAEEANKSELQKAQERLAELEKQLADAALARKELTTQTEIVNAANKMGLVDPDAAYKLLDKGAITYDDGGKPTNVETLLQGLLKEKPYLVGVNKPGAFNYGRGESASGVEVEFMKRNPGLKL